MSSAHDDTAIEPDVVDDDFMDFEAEPRRIGTLTKVLAGLVLIALGFLGGVTVGRMGAESTSAGPARTATTGGGGGGGGGGSATGGSSGGGGTAGSSSGSGVSQAAPASSLNGPNQGGSSRTSAASPPTVSTRTQSTSGSQVGNTGGAPATAQVGSNEGPVTIAPVEPTGAANSAGVGSGGSRSSSPTTQPTG